MSPRQKSPNRSPTSHSPQRSAGYMSPRKSRSPTRSNRSSRLSRELSSMLRQAEYYPGDGSLIEDIPPREWQLLAALARKREQEREQALLAHQLQVMWEKEKAERDEISAEFKSQYHRYLTKKRDQEQLLQQYKTFMREKDDRLRKESMMEYIRDRDNHVSDRLQWYQDQKAQYIMDKAMELESKCLMAASRKTRNEMAEEWKRRLELEDNQQRVDLARQRREAMLKDASQRVAINTALSQWESILLKQEVDMLDECKRAQYSAHAKLTKMRSERLSQERMWRKERAKRVAHLTEQIRACFVRRDDYT